MYVCLCKGITDSQIKECVYAGATTLEQVSQHLGVSTQCGQCGQMAEEIVNQTLSCDSADTRSQFYAAS